MESEMALKKEHKESESVSRLQYIYLRSKEEVSLLYGKKFWFLARDSLMRFAGTTYWRVFSNQD